jgi:hypothetical protein
MLALKEDLTNSEIDSILRVSAVNIDSLNPNYIGKIGSGRLNAGEALRMVQNIIDEELLSNEDDGNNGHGNDEDGVDSSNPGQGNGNQGGNGNHYGWDKGQKELSEGFGDVVVLDMNGKVTSLDNALPGMYFIIDRGVIIKRIYKN